MNARMQENMRQQQPPQSFQANSYAPGAAPASKKNDDYIDFEEVK